MVDESGCCYRNSQVRFYRFHSGIVGKDPLYCKSYSAKGFVQFLIKTFLDSDNNEDEDDESSDDDW